MRQLRQLTIHTPLRAAQTLADAALHPTSPPPLQTFDGRDGREKYPRRWIMLPPVF